MNFEPTFYFLLSSLYYLLETLKHVAKTVVHVELSDHVVEVVFTLFDENGKFFYPYKFPSWNIN